MGGPGGKAEAVQNLPRRFRGDYPIEDPHPPTAAIANQNIQIAHLPHELSPAIISGPRTLTCSFHLLLLIAPLAILGILIFIAVGGVIVLQLWNWAVPSLFGWRPIPSWQALGLLLLCRILFGGFGLRSSGGSNLRRRLEERCERMTPEEREKLRERFLGRSASAAPLDTKPNA